VGASPLFYWLKNFGSTMKESLQERISQIAEAVAEGQGIELVDAQLLGGGKHRVLRLLIDKTGGVTHEDCQSVSHAVGEALDAGDLIPGQGYTLEVSSPGVDRPLVKARDYERFIGQRVQVQVQPGAAIEKRKKFVGKLSAFDGQRVWLEVEPGAPLSFALADIEKANLKYEW
jgi:ribosome maturation factor RimP